MEGYRKIIEDGYRRKKGMKELRKDKIGKEGIGKKRIEIKGMKKRGEREERG